MAARDAPEAPAATVVLVLPWVCVTVAAILWLWRWQLMSLFPSAASPLKPAQSPPLKPAQPHGQRGSAGEHDADRRRRRRRHHHHDHHRHDVRDPHHHWSTGDPTDTLPLLPRDTLPVPFSGGHADGVRLSSDGQVLFKKLQSTHGRGARELAFLRAGAPPTAVAAFVPRFHGVWRGRRQQGQVWVGMTCASRGFALPCVLDLKLSADLPSDSPAALAVASDGIDDERAARKRAAAQSSTLHSLGVKVVAGTVLRRVVGRRREQQEEEVVEVDEEEADRDERDGAEGSGWDARPLAQSTSCGVEEKVEEADVVRRNIGLHHGGCCSTFDDIVHSLGCVRSQRLPAVAGNKPRNRVGASTHERLNL
jgi:hypothetical protein